MRSFASLLFGALAVGAVTLGPADPHALSLGGGAAHATTSVLYTLDELCVRSSRIAVARPTERRSQWEELGGSKRIVTYTKLEIDESVVGDGEGVVWVRTLGGKVDKLGQHVAGEAQFTLGERAVVFLAQAEGALVITGMAQGHFPVIDEADAPRLRSSPDTGRLVGRRGPSVPAREVLVGKRLDEALGAIRAAARAAEK